MKKTINFCGNCPFSYSDYDDFAVGYSTMNICTLSKFLKLKEDCISMSDGHNCDEESKTPNWCPLKTEEFTFEFKEFSSKRKDEIDSTWKEIEVLRDLSDKYDGDYDEPNFIEQENKLQGLYTKFGNLQNNEDEILDDGEFNNELIKQIDCIKEQMFELNEVTNKLQETLNNLDE